MKGDGPKSPRDLVMAQGPRDQSYFRCQSICRAFKWLANNINAERTQKHLFSASLLQDVSPHYRALEPRHGKSTIKIRGFKANRLEKKH